MPNAFWGKILRVNLTTGKISVDEHDWKWYRTYMGGWGLVAYTLLKEVPGNVDPLGPDNKFIFAPGVMTGVAMGGSGRNAVGAKSPLTDGFGEADVGGFWQAELKKAGWDGIIIEGASDKPVYLWIKDDQVEIRDAAHLWGKTTGQVQTMIQQELGDKAIRVTQIGPGGENLAMQACIINDINHAAGRCGLGAVLGSKKLRAVATRGTMKVPVADEAFIKGMAAWTRDVLVNNEGTKALHEYGQAGFTRGQDEGGGLPTRNFQQGHFEGIDKIEGIHMANTLRVKSEGCFACAIRCKQVVKSGPPYNVDPFYGGPEYESVGSLGSSCGVDDLEAVCKANELCNAYGIDTIEVGCTIAWAMEAYERGLLTKEDTGGIDLRFGNGQALVQLTEAIGKREGFGDFLALGSYRAAEKLGKGSMSFVVTARKQETPMHDPRVKNALQIGYATSPTGCDHVHSIHDVGYQTQDGMKELYDVGVFDPMHFEDLGPAKMRMARACHNWTVLWNCVGLCQCFPIDRALMAKVVGAATGWNISVIELQEIGERSLAMAREYNRRCGQTAADDVPPQRFFEPIQNGAFEGHYVKREDFDKALKVYYDIMGWDRVTGAPLDGKLYELGLDWVVEQRSCGC
jgi:aldehyde:ferredoxin oxidoreductase